jgi:hypothetical protein
MGAFIDISGRRFGRLTAIRRVSRPAPWKTPETYWLFKCDCGRDVITRGKDAKSGRQKSCGCGSRVDYSGRTFGYLTAIRETARRPRGKALWLCRCRCGVEVTRSAHGLVNSRFKGSTSSCGCHRHELKLEEGTSQFRYVLSHYRTAAKKRRLEWSLSEPASRRLMESACKYCGSPPSMVQRNPHPRGRGRFVYGGIDRVDNAIGYTPSNSVPCCSRCNRMKWVLSAADFTEHVRRIHDHLFGAPR